MKLRARAGKIGKIRFVSHRDAARIWERALRRAGLAVAFTEGFTPRPKISFGLALPTGAESIAEYIDIEFQPHITADDVDLDTLPQRLTDALPVGFDVYVVAEREATGGSLQEAVTSCTWELWHPRLSATDYADASRLLESAEIVVERERKGKRSADDVRPLILDLRPDPTGDRLIADLATIGRALRPSELASVAFTNIDARELRALRTHQWIEHDGTRREVLPLPADVDARALAVLA